MGSPKNCKPPRIRDSTTLPRVRLNVAASLHLPILSWWSLRDLLQAFEDGSPCRSRVGLEEQKLLGKLATCPASLTWDESSKGFLAKSPGGNKLNWTYRSLVASSFCNRKSTVGSAIASFFGSHLSSLPTANPSIRRPSGSASLEGRPEFSTWYSVVPARINRPVHRPRF